MPPALHRCIGAYAHPYAHPRPRCERRAHQCGDLCGLPPAYLCRRATHALHRATPGRCGDRCDAVSQLCARCHGEDGTTPVGDEDAGINAEAYWGSQDDATILQDIGAGFHGEMTAFAQTYGGPLSWEEILHLAAFVRSWGPLAFSLEMPPMGGATYAETLGPLLVERCGTCHGGMAGLTVTDYASLMAGSASGPVILPGDPQGSWIVQVQRGEHYTRFSEGELNLVVDWIANGAPEK